MRAKGGRGVIAALVLIVAAIGLFALWQSRQADQAKRQLGLDATRMVDEVFNTKRDLRVGQLSGVVIARSGYDGPIFRSTQETRAPVTVDYLLDVARMTSADYAWDGDSKTMTIHVPDVTVAPPNVDMTRAEVRQDGVWISRTAGREMQRQAADRIQQRATERARSDPNMAKARTDAAESVRQLVRQPLAAAGMGDVRVDVRFPYDGARSSERWDTSRSVGEVLGNRN